MHDLKKKALNFLHYSSFYFRMPIPRFNFLDLFSIAENWEMPLAEVTATLGDADTAVRDATFTLDDLDEERLAELDMEIKKLSFFVDIPKNCLEECLSQPVPASREDQDRANFYCLKNLALLDEMLTRFETLVLEEKNEVIRIDDFFFEAFKQQTQALMKEATALRKLAETKRSRELQAVMGDLEMSSESNESDVEPRDEVAEVLAVGEATPPNSPIPRPDPEFEIDLLLMQLEYMRQNQPVVEPLDLDQPDQPDSGVEGEDEEPIFRASTPN